MATSRGPGDATGVPRRRSALSIASGGDPNQLIGEVAGGRMDDIR
jgi:hypothetical protein